MQTPASSINRNPSWSAAVLEALWWLRPMLWTALGIIIWFVIVAPAHADPFPWPPPGTGCPPNSSCIPGGLPGGGNPGQCTPNPNGNPGCNGAGNPVDVITGNKYQHEVDRAPLPGEMGLQFSRHYNSNSTHRGLTGVGWRSSYEVVLVDLGSALQIIDADGRRLTFDRHSQQPGLCVGARPEDGRVIVDDAAQDATTRSASAAAKTSAVYRWQRLDGSEYVFSGGSGDGHPLQSMRAASGATVTLNYLGGALDSVRDAHGRTLRFIYGRPLAAGSTRHRMLALSAIDTPVGRISYRHDEHGRLQSVVHPDGSARRYHYEAEHQGGSGNIWALTGISVERVQNGKADIERLATYRYDAQGRAVRTQHVGGDDLTLEYGPKAETFITTAAGERTVYRHALVAGQWKTVEAIGPGCASCPRSNVRYRFRTDGPRAGQLEATLQLNAQGTPLYQQRVSVDAWGRSMRVERVDFSNSTAAGLPQKPELLWRAQYEPMPHDLRSTALSAANYAALWRPRLVARPSVVAGQEHTVAFSYNAYLQPVAITETGFSPLNGDTGIGSIEITRTTTYHYASIAGVSRLAAVDGPLPGAADIVRHGFDEHGYQKASLSSARSVVVHARDAAGHPTLIAINDGARLINVALKRAADRTPHSTEHAWLLDARGEPDPATYVQRVVEPAPTPTVDASSSTPETLRTPGIIRAAMHAEVSSTRHTNGHENIVRDPWMRPVAWLNADGDPLLRAGWGAPGSAAERHVLSFTAEHARAERLLDDFGRVVAIRAPDQGWQRASYDAADRLIAIIDPRGAVQHAVYDAVGRLTEVKRYARMSTPTSDTSEVLSFAYEGLYVLEEAASDQSGTRTTRTQRDALGREIGLTQTISLAGQAPLAFSLVHTLDQDGRKLRSTLTDAAGRSSTLGALYDAQGRLTSLGVSSLTDQRALVQAIDWQSVQGHWVAAALTHGNGAVDHLLTQTPSSTRRTASEPTPRSGGQQRDLLYRPSVNANAVHARARPGDDHDAAGLPHSMLTEAGELNLKWDAAGRLHEIERSDATLFRYLYDARGRRVAKLQLDGEAVTGATLFIYDGKQMIAEASAEGAIAHRYAYLGYRPVAQLDLRRATSAWGWLKAVLLGPQIGHLHTDHRGTVLRVSDGSQATQWEAEVERFGWAHVKAQAEATVHQPLRLIGQYADAESGLHYHVGRFYAPHDGKFLSPDPHGIADALTEVPAAPLLDAYAYASGAPDEFFDPDGAARVRYYAIDGGARVSADLMPNRGHWAFVIYDINSGAAQGRTFVYDRGGSFFTGTPYQLFQVGASNPRTGFETHYQSRAGYYSPASFELNMDDLDATIFIEQLTGLQLGTLVCRPVSLPPINLGLQGILNPQAAGGQPNRIVSCNAAATDADVRLQRVKKAIEVHESGGDHDCASATWLHCPAKTWAPALNPQTNTRQPASYGWVQFVLKTFLGELNQNFAAYQNSLAAVGITHADITAARAREAAAETWYRNLRGRGLDPTNYAAAWAADGATFSAQTGLQQRDYERMLRWHRLYKDLDAMIGSNQVQQACGARGTVRHANCVRGYIDRQTQHPTESAADYAARVVVRDRMRLDAAALGTSLSRDELNPYIREEDFEGEARNSFMNAAVFADRVFGPRLLGIFANKPQHDLVADVWLQKLIRLAGTRDHALRNPTTPAQEETLALRVMSTHNRGEPYRGANYTAYTAHTLPIWQRTFCVAGTGTDRYLRLSPLLVSK